MKDKLNPPTDISSDGPVRIPIQQENLPDPMPLLSETTVVPLRHQLIESARLLTVTATAPGDTCTCHYIESCGAASTITSQEITNSMQINRTSSMARPPNDTNTPSFLTDLCPIRPKMLGTAPTKIQHHTLQRLPSGFSPRLRLAER